MIESGAIDPAIPTRTPSAALRAAISRLALRTPERLYGSQGLNPSGWDVAPMRGVVPALALLVDRASEEIPDGVMVEIDLEGLMDENEVDYGSWNVSLVCQHVTPSDIDPHAMVPGEGLLLRAGPETIRASLSRLAARLDRTVFLPAGFSAKTDVGDDPYASAEAGSILLCSTLRFLLMPGRHISFDFTGILHGLKGASRWKVVVRRISLGDDPEAEIVRRARKNVP